MHFWHNCNLTFGHHKPAAKHTEGQGNLEKENEVPGTNSGVVAHADKRAKTSRGVGGAVAGGQSSAYDEAEPELAFEQEEAHREPDIDVRPTPSFFPYIF